MNTRAPNVTRLESAQVLDLSLRIHAAQRALRERVNTQLETSGPGRCNHWVAADEFLRAFTHLRLPGRLRLACVFTSYAAERQSWLVARRRDNGPGKGDCVADLPDISKALRAYAMRNVFERDDQPPELPDWIVSDVSRAVEDDGAASAFFERSILARWCNSVLNGGHYVGWGWHMLVAEDSQMIRDFGDKARRIEPAKPLELPEDWRPTVLSDVVADDASSELPQCEDGRERLRGKRVSRVTFYSYSDYLTQAIYRHNDWFVGPELVWSEGSAIAEGGSGFMV